MAEQIPLELPDNPRLAQNIIHFARALRRAGLPVGPGRVIDAIRAVEAAGFSDRMDFYWTLHACFVNRPEHRIIYAQIFRLYWRDPRYLEHMMSMMLPSIRGVQEEKAAQAGEKRAAQALLGDHLPEVPQEEEQESTQIEVDASLTISAEERLRTLDFEQMSTEEMAQAKRMIVRLTLPVKPIESRRSQAAVQGKRIDHRRTLRVAMRRGGELRDIARAKPRLR